MAEHEESAEATDEQTNHEQDDSAGRQSDTMDAMRRELLNAIGDLRAEVARLQMDEARGRLRQWIRDNPTLAIFLATGAGIVAGRLITTALTPSPPPPLPERVRKQVQTLAEAARRQAQEAGEGVSRQAAAARRQADRTRKAAEGRAAEAGERLRQQARNWSTAVADRATALQDQASAQAESFGASLSQEAEGVRSSITDKAARASKTLESSAQGITDTADKVQSGYKAAKFGAKVAKLVFALLVAKKGTKWIRKML
jgi:ElaB/YqjD/DUF883 family membrane-anchored ribosome-binding protein